MDEKRDAPYEKMAVIYDELMYDVPYDDWAAYIVSLMDARGANVLEYACGTGNITLPMAARGCAVVAVDRSRPMLGQAEQKARGCGYDIRFVCADMIDFSLNRAADYAVCACDGVNYILDTPSLRLFFAHVYVNIQAGGKFLFDISSEYKLSVRLGNEFYFDDADGQTVFWSNRYHEKKKIVEMELTLFVRAGDVYKRYDEIHRQRAWGTEEITRALEKAGFDIEGIYAFQTKTAATACDERIQFVAVKENKKHE